MKDRICEGSSFTVEQVVDRLRIVNVHLTLEECYLLLSVSVACTDYSRIVI